MPPEPTLCPETTPDGRRPVTGTGHAPRTAVTPSPVPAKAKEPASDRDEKCGRAAPRLIFSLTAPVAGLSSYRTPEGQLVTHTAPPPVTGEPFASAGPRHSTRIRLPATLTAAIPPLRQGS